MVNKQDIDKEVIAEVLSGNTNAFGQIVDKYKDRVAAVCFKMLKDPNLAEEIGQQTFIRLYKSLDQFKFDSSLATYVTRIAINLSLNKLDSNKRRFKRFVAQEENHINYKDNSPNTLDGLADKQLVEMCLQSLKPASRSVVILRMIEGYSIKETSQMLGIAEGTIMSKLNRAMKKMKETLKKLGIENG